jgi:hypothetical protein
MNRLILLLGASLLLASVASADLAVQVWPDKLQVRPGEPVQLQVTVTGLPPGQTAAVHCRVERLLDSPAARFDGTTDGAGKVAFTFKPQAEFGYEAVAEAAAGEARASGREVFACAQNPWAACVSYGGDSFRMWNQPPPGQEFDSYLLKRISEWVASCRFFYSSVCEILGIAYDPFSSVLPPPGIDNYFSGQGDTVYKGSVVGLRKLIADLHASGVYSTIYVNSSVSGVGGTEFARKHPEYLTFSRDGTVCGGISTTTLPLLQRFYREYPASLTAPEFEPIRASIGPGGLHIAPLNFEDPVLIDVAIKSLTEGRKALGYDGVRYDGHYCVPAIGDPLAPSSMLLDYTGKPQPSVRAGDALTARNMRRAMGEIRRQYPDFLFGFNWAGFRPDQGTWALQSQEAQVITPGSYILDEVAKAAGESASPDNRWEDFARNMCEEGDRARQFGAFLFAGWGGGPGWNEVDTRWIKAFSWAAGARWIPGDSRDNREATRLYNQFACRYSQFLVSNDLHRLPQDQAAKLVQISASRPIIYDRFVQRLGSKEGRYLVVHLINTPLEERVTTKAQAPPLAERVQVTLSAEAFGGGQPPLDQARALNPDATPQRQLVTTGDVPLTLQVPSFQYWTVLVIPY